MIRKLVIAVCCLALVAVAGYGWAAYQNKQRFEAVMAEHSKAPQTGR